jgi:prepilin-type N-terminal cleavage/methylation domain-containing protein
MKQLSIQKKQKGFTLIEVIIVIVIIGILSVAAMGNSDNAQSTGEIAAAKSQVETLMRGAKSYAGYNGDLTGISMTELSSMGKVPEDWGDGTGILPWNGDMAISVDSTDETRATITLSGINSDAKGNSMVRDYEYLASTGTTPSYSSGTFTITVLGR